MAERLNGSREPIASRVERDVQRRVMADLQRNPPGAAGPTTESSSTSSSSDLTSSLVTRLTKLEKEWTNACNTIHRKDSTIAQLSLQFEDFRRLHANCSKAGPSSTSPQPDPQETQEVARLMKENARLRRQLKYAWSQVGDMKQFFNDYGMVWVGTSSQFEDNDEYNGASMPEDAKGHNGGPLEPSISTSAEHQLAPLLASRAAPPLRGEPSRSEASAFSFPNMALMRERVEELNHLAGDGKATVVTGAHGEARLKMPDSLPLVMFRDGFQLKGGPLRLFTQPNNRNFVQDILDGYFPYELKNEFPEGVPFQLIDKTDCEFAQAFSAVGASNVHSIRYLS
mmetsp:Transcript_32415/g.62287  ORF Transcript_32415/g.62287 Transcript_32415/m.62287 type:complete len:340 (+) Transcript_32415:303-1322(+)